ncbi:MAG: 50S ribosomal protein L24 [Desulfobacterales bacterium]|jgi:large subunit ribosomal protein L24|nr:50S ribosomal protein L24 [Desulfobacterales bacterium]
MIVPRFHIKKNDLIMVVQGRERGKSGRVLRVLPEKKKVIVEKINFVKRHTRPHGQQRRGGILEKEAPLHISNVRLLCEKCNKPVRIRHRVLEGGKKARVCHKCGESFDK